ncbi:MAG: DMT family transporter [Chloroflexota bacterium]
MQRNQAAGIQAALTSAALLGLTPVLGRQAILLGFSPLAVVALRTFLAAFFLLLIVIIFKRPFLYIFPIGLIGCFLAGAINGLGSILYYMALARLSASVGQLLYSLYPLFVVFWLLLDRHYPTRLTLIRIGLATIAVLLLTREPNAQVDPLGVLLMLGASILYALHLPINQRVLYEVPAPTVTLYTLIAMSAVVVPAYLMFDRQWPATTSGLWPVLGLTFVTFTSRLMLFFGVKHLGGIQTALLGLGELLVTISISHIWLREELTTIQWLGVAALFVSLMLARTDKHAPPHKGGREGWLSWIRPPDLPPEIPFGPQD